MNEVSAAHIVSPFAVTFPACPGTGTINERRGVPASPVLIPTAHIECLAFAIIGSLSLAPTEGSLDSHFGAMNVSGFIMSFQPGRTILPLGVGVVSAGSSHQRIHRGRQPTRNARITFKDVKANGRVETDGLKMRNSSSRGAFVSGWFPQNLGAREHYLRYASVTRTIQFSHPGSLRHCPSARGDFRSDTVTGPARARVSPTLLSINTRYI